MPPLKKIQPEKRRSFAGLSLSQVAIISGAILAVAAGGVVWYNRKKREKVVSKPHPNASIKGPTPNELIAMVEGNSNKSRRVIAAQKVLENSMASPEERINAEKILFADALEWLTDGIPDPPQSQPRSQAAPLGYKPPSTAQGPMIPPTRPIAVPMSGHIVGPGGLITPLTTPVKQAQIPTRTLASPAADTPYRTFPILGSPPPTPSQIQSRRSQNEYQDATSTLEDSFLGTIRRVNNQHLRDQL